MAIIDTIQTWQVVFDVAGETYAHVHLIPPGDDATDWRRSLEIAVERTTAPVDLLMVAEHARTSVLVRVGDAADTFSFEIRTREPWRVLYVWRLRGHCLLEDQICVTSFALGDEGLRAVTFAARGSGSAEILESGVRLVADLPRGWWPTSAHERGRTPHRLVDDAEWARIAAQLSEPPPLLGQYDAERRRAATVGRITRSAQPELWAVGNALFAMSHLQKDGARQEDLELAARSLQHALEVLEPGSGIWARAVRSLAVAWGKMADRGAAHRRACAVYAARTALAAFEGLGHGIEVAAVKHLLGVELLRSSDLDLTVLREAVGLLQDALSRTSLDSSPIEWGDITLSLADAYFDLDAFGEAGAAKSGVRLYEEVLAAVTEDRRFQHDRALAERAAGLTTTASARLVSLDRAGVSLPVLPSGWDDRPIRGEALYLRPLATAGEIMLRNRFDPERLAVRFETEPDPISLEAALHRALGTDYLFQAVGGRSNGLGTARSYVIGGEGWRQVVELLLSRATLIVMSPSRSAGVRWEIEQLIALDALQRALFLFPPDDGTPGIAELIDGGRWILNDFGIGVPDPDPQGVWFQSDVRGTVTRVIPFGALWEGMLPRLLEPPS